MGDIGIAVSEGLRATETVRAAGREPNAVAITSLLPTSVGEPVRSCSRAVYSKTIRGK